MGFFEELFSARPEISRTADEQHAVDAQTQTMTLYQTSTCPYCIRVLRQIKRLSLKIELRDVYRVPQYRAELLQGGGDTMIPCLRYRDESGQHVWMYESADIVAYLEQRFAEGLQ